MFNFRLPYYKMSLNNSLPGVAYRNISLTLFSVATGALFLYSAYTKAFPIETFEYTMVEFLHLPWLAAAFAARVLLGIEASIGVLLVFNLYGKNKWLLKSSFVLLVLFTAYIIYLWAQFGNHVNCGCFGDAIWMSPAASLIKNIVLLLVITVLILYGNGVKFKWAAHSIIIVLIILAILPFILFGLPAVKPDWTKNGGYSLDLSPLYAKEKKDIPQVDLARGKYIIAFFSPQCPHCRMAAYKMHVMHQHNPQLPLYMVIGGSRDLSDFWKATRAQDIGYTRLEAAHFFKIVGGEVPFIAWVNNSKVEAKSDYGDLNEAEIGKWLSRQ